MYQIDVRDPITCCKLGRMKQTNGWEHSGRAIRDHLWVLVLDGQADFFFEEESLHVEKGDVLLIPACQFYKANTESFCEYFFIHFSATMTFLREINLPVFKQDFSYQLAPPAHPFIYLPQKCALGKQAESITSMVMTCMEYNGHSTHAGRLLVDNQLERILLQIGEQTEQAENPPALPALLERILIYIRLNLTANLSLETTSQHFSLSKSYIARLFRLHLHTTLSAYVNGEKLKYACELLSNTRMSISEISTYLSYSNVFYFSKLFKKQYGQSPSHYVKRN